MYDSKTNLIIGFHGCDEDIRNKLLNRPNFINKSEKPYDWLGHGFYFWENNFERAHQWAKDKEKRGEITKASVIGAVISLNNCLDLTESKFIKTVTSYYELMSTEYSEINAELPKNTDAKNDIHKDKLVRELDCAVIEFMHQKISEQISIDKLSD